MAKLELTFCGVTGTLTEEGAPDDPKNIKMSTGSEHSEGYCYYSVKWEKTTLVQDPNNPKKYTSITTKDTGTVCFAFNLQNVRFTKKMYSPNEIYAEVQIAPGTPGDGQKDSNVTYVATIPKDTLESSFTNKKVILACDDKQVCDDYFIQEVVPTYKKDSMYVTFKIYSPDYFLTQEKYCRSFVSKKLGAEILAEEMKNYRPYGGPLQIAGYDYSLMKHIKKDGKEHIFPYLVQYNESFYDFLKRTTNRWGEFLYYEDKKLLIGYGYAAEANGDYKDKDIVSETSFSDLTKLRPQQLNAGTFNAEAPIDKQILDNKLTKGKYDSVKAEIDSLGNNAKGGDVYLMKKLAALLTNDKSVWPFLLDQGIHDGISLYKAKEISHDLNKKFDDSYFNKKNAANVTFDSEQFNGNEFNEFSEYSPILNIEEYAKILKKELASGQNAIVFDFDTTYPGIKLGQVFTYDEKKYLAVQVEGYQPDMLEIVNNTYVERTVDMTKVRFKVTAIPESRVDSADTTYYPPVIPEGHVRRSGTQLATVVDADDPLRQNRVRVKFDWQSDENIPSPWLIYSNPAGSYKDQSKTNNNRGGIIGRHYVGEPVVVDFACGNVERPYVVGSVETRMPLQLQTNDIVLTTPGAQTIKMTDGRGRGVNALLASLNPGVSILQTAVPGLSIGNFDRSEYLEGAIELGDKYGFWSIKGSTNDRNITVKSPWGDVKISAFTGITISAPNGDIKIKGKNVSIEAGSNLTLKSGKNIDDKFLVDSEDWSSKGLTGLGTMIAKGVASAVAQEVAEVTDLSLLRSLLEIVLKPVEGKLQITAGRYMMLEAGKKQTGYPIDAYKASRVEKKAEPCADIKHCVESFDRVKPSIERNYTKLIQTYLDARPKAESLVPLIDGCKSIRNELQTKSVDDIINALWQNPSADPESTIGFKDQYRKLNASDDIDWSVMVRFIGPGAMRIFNRPDDVKKANWEFAIIRQEAQKTQIINTVKELGELIGKLKNFEFIKDAKKYKELNGLLDLDHMPDDSMFKRVSQEDNFKKFTNVYLLLPLTERKKTFRKIFIDLVKKFDIKRSALVGGGLLTKPTVAPEPTAPYDDDAAWAEYVKSIQNLPVKKPSEGAKIAQAFLDPLANVFSASGFKDTFYDDWAYGSSKKGEILFASEDGTMVLDRNIYRANVGGSEQYQVEGDQQDQQNQLVNGYATKVRKAMLGA